MPAFAYKTTLTFHCVAFGRVEIEKGIERVSGCVDLTQNFKFWPVPLPPAYNPVCPGFWGRGRKTGADFSLRTTDSARARDQ